VSAAFFQASTVVFAPTVLTAQNGLRWMWMTLRHFSATMGKRRKPEWYAVARGANPGLYKTWSPRTILKKANEKGGGRKGDDGV